MIQETSGPLNCDRVHVEDPPNYVKYYCSSCTARKRQGTTFCPFCGNQGHYHHDPFSDRRLLGTGRVNLHTFHPDTVNEAGAGHILGVSPQEPQPDPKADKTRYPIFSQLQAALMTAENAFNLQVNSNEELRQSIDIARKHRHDAREELGALQVRLRMAEDKAKVHEDDLVTAHEKRRQLTNANNALTGDVVELKASRDRAYARIDSLLAQVQDMAKSKPIAVRAVYGQRDDKPDGLLEVLPILSMSQGDSGSNVTVRLPR